jgi:hypothetical protein
MDASSMYRHNWTLSFRDFPKITRVRFNELKKKRERKKKNALLLMKFLWLLIS